jgi:prolyl-tRNA synthetase
MGCYGIGTSRLVGAIVETHHDDKGMKWPASVAPFAAQLVPLFGKDETQNAAVRDMVTKLEAEFIAAGREVLVDDRAEVRAGEKFADADLLGMPVRLVISEKSLAAGGVEWKGRGDAEAQMVPMVDVVAKVSALK